MSKTSSPFDASEFYSFSKALKIDSKERGLMSLGDNLLGTQTRLLEQVSRGFDDGVREFVCLKCRQIGASTLSLALDLYWAFKYRGVTGALVTQDDGARDDFRSKLKLYYSGLPEEWTQEIVDDNRNQLVLGNGSKIHFRVAGTTARGAGKLGRGGALAFAHLTETAFWGDAKSIHSLRSSFAETNPVRYYMWESTANGFNHFHDMWMDAKKSLSVRCIFISFWANELYRCEAGSIEYQTYWGKSGRLTADERDWVREVKALYGVTIEPEQVAWYRWMGAEKLTDESMLAQEFPATEERAFIETGSAFFKAIDITKAIKQCKVVDAPDCYRIETGPNFWDTRVIPAKAKQVTLKVWQPPEPTASYVIGCDPSWASSEDSDRTCISVWRAWYNRLEQVAEFCSPEISTHATAWILCYMAGYYDRCWTNIEITGPGSQVLVELQNLRRQAGSRFESDHGPAIMTVTKNIKQYLYRRPDNPSGSIGALHTKTSHEIKERMMNGLRDNFERGILVIRSLEMVEEMKSVKRDGGAAPAAPTGRKDDRVVGAALACMCWSDQMRQGLLGQRQIWIPEENKEVARVPTPMEGVIGKYFDRLGIGAGAGVPRPPKRLARNRPRWMADSRKVDKVTF